MKLKQLATAFAIVAGITLSTEQQAQNDNDKSFPQSPDASLCLEELSDNGVTCNNVIDRFVERAEQFDIPVSYEAYTTEPGQDPGNATSGYTFIKLIAPYHTEFLMINNREHTACVVSEETYNHYKKPETLRSINTKTNTPKP